MIYGYTRPYADDPTCEKQLEILQSIEYDKIFTEEHASAKKRIELDQLLNSVKSGDKVVVAKLFCLADSTRHLVELLDFFQKNNIQLHSLNEGIDTSSNSYSFFEIVKHLVDFQSDVISEKTRNGLSKAKEKGKSTGRPRKPDANVKRAIMMYQSKKYTLEEIQNETGISKSTLYRYLEQ